MKARLNRVLNVVKMDIDIDSLWKVLLFTLVFGFIVHGYNYFNADYLHDSLSAYNQKSDIMWKVTLGRFMQAISIYLRGYANLPLINGILGLVFIGLSSYIIAISVGIRSKISICFISAFFITSLAYCYTNLIYFHESDSFMLALLFASLSVYTFTRFKYGYLFAAIFVAISCGFYQAYISVVMMLLAILLIRDIINGVESRAILINSLKSIATVAFGLILYFIIFKTLYFVCDLQPSNIVTYNDAGQALEFDYSFYIIYRLYWVFVQGVFVTYNGFRDMACFIFNFAIIGYAGVMILLRLKSNRVSILNIMLFVLILLFSPLIGNFTAFLSKGFLHSLQGGAFPAIYVLPLLLLEDSSTMRKWLIYLCMFGVVFNGIIFINEKYMRRSQKALATYNIMSNVYNDIVTTEHYIYNNDAGVVFLGDINNLAPLHNNYKMRYGKILNKLYWESNPSNEQSFNILGRPNNYFKFYFNTEVNVVGNSMRHPIPDQLLDFADSMPEYPNKGYVQTKNDTIYVKFPLQPKSYTMGLD